MKYFLTYILIEIVFMMSRIKNFFAPQRSGELLVSGHGSIVLDIKFKNPNFVDVKFVHVNKSQIPTCAPMQVDELSWTFDEMRQKTTHSVYFLTINWKLFSGDTAVIRWTVK